MIPIHFHAAYYPDYLAFRVSMVFPKELPKPDQQIIAEDGGCNVQLDVTRPNVTAVMSPSEYIAWAHSHGPLIIDGITVDFVDESTYGMSELQIRSYFRKVADEYQRYISKKN